MEKLTLILNTQTVNMILNLLSEVPYKVSSPMIHEIMQQLPKEENNKE